MADTGAGRAQAFDLRLREVNAVGEPDIVGQPVHVLEIVEGAHPELRKTELVLVAGFSQMGMESDPMCTRKLCGRAHQLPGDGERRARRERDLAHGMRGSIVITPDQSFRLGQNRVLGFGHGPGRQPAVFDREAHRAAGQHHPHAQLRRLFGLYVDRLRQRGRKQVVMVTGRGAAGEHQLGQREAGGYRDRLFREVRPDRVQRLQPVEQRLVQCGRIRARQCLVEMVVTVDQSGQQHAPGGIDHAVDAGLGLLAPSHQLHDPVFPHDDSAGSVEIVCGEDRRGLLDPGGRRMCCHCFGLLGWTSGLARYVSRPCFRASETPGDAAVVRFETRADKLDQ